MKRLSVNINDETAAEIRRVCERDQISATEAVRRLIGGGAWLDRRLSEDGKTVLVESAKGWDQVRSA